MKSLADQIDRLIATQGLPWQRDGQSVRVDLTRRGRIQTVRLMREDDRYVFRSTVLAPVRVTASDRVWRDLAYRAWRRNGTKDLVTFSFDDDDALIGIIEMPTATLDDNELRMYIDTLAKECDRFEYALTGEDIE